MGTPIQIGTSEPGAQGPGGPGTAGLVRALPDLGHRTGDRGDARPRLQAADRGLTLSHAVSAVLADAAMPVVLGGDHGPSLGTFDALLRWCRDRPLFVRWLDAHADFNTWETSPPEFGTTVPGGATFRDAHLIMETLHGSGRAGSLDVVALVANPFGHRILDRPRPVIEAVPTLAALS